MISAMKDIISKLQKNKLAVAFLKPVDAEALGLYNYFDVIKKPMDLSTLRRRLPSYEKVNSFIVDLQLIWDNCKVYNLEDSVSRLFY